MANNRSVLGAALLQGGQFLQDYAVQQQQKKFREEELARQKQHADRLYDLNLKEFDLARTGQQSDIDWRTSERAREIGLLGANRAAPGTPLDPNLPDEIKRALGRLDPATGQWMKVASPGEQSQQQLTDMQLAALRRDEAARTKLDELLAGGASMTDPMVAQLYQQVYKTVPFAVTQQQQERQIAAAMEQIKAQQQFGRQGKIGEIIAALALQETPEGLTPEQVMQYKQRRIAEMSMLLSSTLGQDWMPEGAPHPMSTLAPILQGEISQFDKPDLATLGQLESMAEQLQGYYAHAPEQTEPLIAALAQQVATLSQGVQPTPTIYSAEQRSTAQQMADIAELTAMLREQAGRSRFQPTNGEDYQPGPPVPTTHGFNFLFR